jgi:hypothetical protein
LTPFALPTIKECSSFLSNSRKISYEYLTNIFRYEHLDLQAKNFQNAKAKNPSQTFEESLDVKIKGFAGGDLSWIYQNDIQTVWEDFLRKEESA